MCHKAPLAPVEFTIGIQVEGVEANSDDIG